MCHSYLAEDTAGSWLLFSSVSFLSFSVSSVDFEVHFLNLRSLDLDFFSLRSSGVFLSGVSPFVSLSELMPTSRPVGTDCRDVRCEVWGVRCEVWGVRCEVWGVRCEVWGVRCEVWDASCEKTRRTTTVKRQRPSSSSLSASLLGDQ